MRGQSTRQPPANRLESRFAAESRQLRSRIPCSRFGQGSEVQASPSFHRVHIDLQDGQPSGLVWDRHLDVVIETPWPTQGRIDGFQAIAGPIPSFSLAIRSSRCQLASSTLAGFGVSEERTNAISFRRLHQLVEAMPLSSDEFSFAYNWLCSAEQLWEKRDRNAARYQVDQVAKKLVVRAQ